jgi:lipoyl(octanoyl) transferase
MKNLLPVQMTDDPKINHLGLTDYMRVWSDMKTYTVDRTPACADVVWLTQHHPVYTLGLAGLHSHVLDAGQIPLVKTDRGGQVTYHGPGQLVVYPLLDLRRYGLRVREYVTLLEQVLIETLREIGLPHACRKESAPGVYLPWDSAPGGLAKVAALGIKVRQGCAYHGLSLNVDMDLQPFLGINPCGYEGLKTVDLKSAGVKIALDDVADRLTRHLVTGLQQARSAEQATSAMP